MAEIILFGNKRAIVDDPDRQMLSKFNWFWRGSGALIESAGYAWRNTRNDSGGKTTISMHREIMNPPDDMEVDHINGDGLDNRRANLRLCTRSENSRNVRPRNGTASRFKGVTFHKQSGLWRARIKMDGREHSLGYFKDDAIAAKAYNAAAIRYFGEYAHPNFLEAG